MAKSLVDSERVKTVLMRTPECSGREIVAIYSRGNWEKGEFEVWFADKTMAQVVIPG